MAKTFKSHIQPSQTHYFNVRRLQLSLTLSSMQLAPMHLSFKVCGLPVFTTVVKGYLTNAVFFFFSL